VGAQRHDPAALPPERPITQCIGGWLATVLVWTGAEILAPTWNRTPDHAARSQSI
jgi:hypothetical protein